MVFTPSPSPASRSRRAGTGQAGRAGDCPRSSTQKPTEMAAKRAAREAQPAPQGDGHLPLRGHLLSQGSCSSALHLPDQRQGEQREVASSAKGQHGRPCARSPRGGRRKCGDAGGAALPPALTTSLRTPELLPPARHLSTCPLSPCAQARQGLRPPGSSLNPGLPAAGEQAPRHREPSAGSTKRPQGSQSRATVSTCPRARPSSVSFRSFPSGFPRHPTQMKHSHTNLGLRVCF